MGLPTPKKGAVFYEDEKLYATLANFPITRGHVVVVWKDNVQDLHLLKREDYEHLMDIVDEVRNAMIKTLAVEKVYLLYMDETKHVHWHLVPRYNEEGANLLIEEPEELKDTYLAKKIKENMKPLN